jgi:hypothetical protein
MIDSDLNQRFAALVDPTDDSSWFEVLRRSRELTLPRRVRARMALAAALALAVLIVAPAVALHGRVLRLFKDAPPAPQRVEKSFALFEKGVPPRLQSGVEATEARKVLDVPVGSDETAILWLAPRVRGGFCTLMELDRAGGGRRGAGGECTPLLRRLSFETSLHGRVSPTGEIRSGPVLLDGWVGISQAATLELAFEDGRTADIPLTWVSPPVDAGFFIYSVPELHWQPGHLPTTLVARDSEGKVLAQGDVTGIDLRPAYGQP